MKFQTPLIQAIFIKRYKRFFADATLPDGSLAVAHCANSGSMKGLLTPEQPCWLSPSNNPARKLKYSLELIQTPQSLVCVNTSLPNKLVHEALENGTLNHLFCGIRTIKPEQKYGKSSRIDLLLEEKNGRLCFIEVKNVTLKEGGHAAFPDSVTARGAKHLEELIDQVKQGHRAMMFYLINREDCPTFTIAEKIDPTYATFFKKARAAGVEMVAYQAKLSQKEVYVHRPVEIVY